VSVPGVYAGFIDKFPMGIVVNKGLTIRSGQTHVHKHVPKLMQLILAARSTPAR
jgi:threonine dehydrogenase-like Zn-dependent dehydrogenase